METKEDLKKLLGPFLIRHLLGQSIVPGFAGTRLDIALKHWEKAVVGARNAERPIPILERIIGIKIALLVIDMQRIFLDPGASNEVPEGRSIIKNINRIATKLRECGGLVIFFRYLVNENVGMLKYFESKSYIEKGRESPLKAMQPGHPQFELHPELEVRKEDLVLDKVRYSAVIGSNIVEVLQEKNIENVIVTGVTTDVCAGNTTEDLMQKDFHVVMVWDGTSALDRLEHELYLARIFGLYGDVMPTEEVISRLV